MEDYSSNAFLQAFNRFSCEVGYPKNLLTDEGSQLVKGCETLKFNYNDIQWKLSTESLVTGRCFGHHPTKKNVTRSNTMKEVLLENLMPPKTHPESFNKISKFSTLGLKYGSLSTSSIAKGVQIGSFVNIWSRWKSPKGICPISKL